MKNTIKCPYCHKEFEATEALKHQIEEEVSASIEDKYKKKIEEARIEGEEKAKKAILDEVDLKLKDKDNENEELKSRNKELSNQVLGLNKNVRELIYQNNRRN